MEQGRWNKEDEIGKMRYRLQSRREKKIIFVTRGLDPLLRCNANAIKKKNQGEKNYITN
jgi:hypothetical protein